MFSIKAYQKHSESELITMKSKYSVTMELLFQELNISYKKVDDEPKGNTYMPALTRLQPECIPKTNQIRAGVRLDVNDLNRIQILGSIAQKAIAADKNQRYESAKELLKSLEVLMLP